MSLKMISYRRPEFSYYAYFNRFQILYGTTSYMPHLHWPPSRNFVCLFSARKFKIAFAISFMAKFIIRQCHLNWIQMKLCAVVYAAMFAYFQIITYVERNEVSRQRCFHFLKPWLGWELRCANKMSCHSLRP